VTDVSRILTTHTGSMPRPPRLLELMRASVQGQTIDRVEYERVLTEAVADTVASQREAGVDIVSDGEMSKVAWNIYAKYRLSGFGGTRPRPASLEDEEFPDVAEYLPPQSRVASMSEFPVCDGPVRYVGTDAVRRDIENFKHALAPTDATGAFMTSASPGAICGVFGEGYYPTYETYLAAVTEAMKEEYRAIVDAGLTLQLDAPDLTIEAHRKFRGLTTEQFRRIVAINIQAMNAATAGLPEDQLRLHVCWGNIPRPHTHDIPLQDILELLLEARVGALSIEASNPRHEHEWRLFENVRLPDGMLLIPGVIDSTSNYVEHPELVAERITRFAKLVGREKVLAGSDCGFGTGAGGGWVAPSVVRRKLQSLTEGAQIASQTLWN
jgi:5-methyltetrahydropteroyltriglutamate--homocysteine methyltransferase